MKNRYFLSALALIACISCTKTVAENPSVCESGNFETIEFHICASSEMKTTISDGGKCLWEAGDQIKIMCLDSEGTQKNVTATVPTAGTTTKVTATVESADYYYAVYPAAIDAVLDQTGKVTFTVPATTDGTLKNAMICLAKTSKEDASFSFQHAVSLLSFEIQRTDVKSVSIVTKESSKLSGKVECTFESGSIVTGAAETSSINVTVGGAGKYYAPIPEGVSTTALALKMKTSNADEYIPAVNVVPSSTLTFSRNALKNLGRIDNRVITDYYYSVDGTGSGKEPSSPAGLSNFKAMLANNAYQNSISDGATFHFAAGTYVFDAAISVSPVSSCHFNIVGAGTGTDGTIFSGNSKTNFFKLAANTILSISSLKMTSGKSADNGGAIFINGGKLNIENCELSSNTAKSGGVLYATGTADVDITNCNFFSNTSSGTSNAPSVAMLWQNAFVKFNGCAFGSNTASDRAVINSQGTSLVFLNACAFNNNKNSAASTYASAIHAGGAGFAINNSTFYQNNGKGSDNKPYNNCECINAVTNMVIANTTFYEYFQTNRGVIASTAAKKGVLFNDIILGNWTGAVLYFSSANYNMTSKGHNIYMTISDYRTGEAKIGLPAATGDIAGTTKDVLNGATWDSTNRVYKWNGTLKTGTLTKATPSEFEPAVKSMTETVSNTVVGSGTQLGNAFWNWLVSISATTTDQLGNQRGSEWWPGSYQE